MGKICLIISRKVLQCLNPRSSEIISYLARDRIGDYFEFN
jgi:hypothetical protein